MVSKLLLAWAVMAICVAIHAGGVASAMRWLRRQSSFSLQFWRCTSLFARLAGWMVLLHLFEILAWALVYFWSGAMPELASAVYFSGVTYTTTGYGDLVLPKEWRLVGGVESLTGVLMCGWSTGFFFAIVSRVYEPQEKTSMD